MNKTSGCLGTNVAIKSLAPGRCNGNRRLVIFKLINDKYHLQVNGTRPNWWLVNIGSGNGLVLSGNKSLRKPMMTQIYVAIWCPYAIMSWWSLFNQSINQSINKSTNQSINQSINQIEQLMESIFLKIWGLASTYPRIMRDQKPNVKWHIADP